MDFFKVVYIKELKEVEPVPHLWEEKGKLFWPPSKKEVRQNQSDPKSIPKKNWIEYTCEVKQRDIVLFHHASATADLLCNDSSTEEEKEEQEPKRRRTLNRPADKENYDSYFQMQNASTSKTSKDCQEVVLVNPIDPINQNEFGSDTVSDQTEDQTIVSSGTLYDMIPNKQLSLEFKKLYEFLNKFEQNTNNKFAEVSTKLDNMEKRFRDFETPTDRDQDTSMVFPIDNIRNVQELEKQLDIPEYKTKIFGHLRRVVGTGQYWKTACYKLNLLTSFSWTGISRTNIPKEPFNKLGNILDIFYRVVQYSDHSFNYTQRDAFFRDGVLKHSVTRLKGSKKKSLVHDGDRLNVENEEQQEIEENME